jgi:hypothetical protein
MRGLGDGRVFVLGQVTPFEEDGIQYLRLVISSVRGDYDMARTRNVPKHQGLPSAHNQPDDNEEQSKC